MALALSFYHPTPSLSKKPNARPIRASSCGGAGSGLASPPEEGELPLPRWAGETPMSRLVGALISFKPLFSLMKLAARQLIISTAEKSNVPWRDMTKEILESDVYKEIETIRNHSLVYPRL